MRTIHDGLARRVPETASLEAPHQDNHDDPSLPLLPAGFSIDRRRFLRSSLTAVGAYAVAAAGGSWLVGPDKAWAVELDALDADLSKGLLAMVRAIYPHDRIGDVYYAMVVKDLDVEASGFDDKERLEVIRAGLRQLDTEAGGSFISAAPDAKEAALTAIADTEFFRAVRGKAVVSLYNQPEVWTLFGYEGPSYEKGGYLLNGFNDLSFLPDPPADASPHVVL